jgi:site-specific recombinase XerD
MGLDLYRRHGPHCKYSEKGQAFTKCTCMIWAYGSIVGRPVRESLRTRDWTIATRIAQEMESSPGAAVRAMTIADAVNEFVGECHARKLAKSTITSYENTLSAFLKFCEHKHLTDIRALRLDEFRGFRASRQLAATTQRKEIETLRTFGKFCHAHDWIAKNFAADVRPPKEPGPVTMPYERDEISKLLEACDEIENSNQAFADRARLRARALILLMLYSGMRVSDVIRVERSRLGKDGRLMMRAMKTGVPLYVRLHPDCVAALSSLPLESRYFLWSGNGKITSATGSARRTVNCISKISGVKARPHRFRDTFAVELLAQGEDIRTVQLLLGHESIKTTEKHYAPYVMRFQQRLDDATGKLHFG